LGERDEEVTQAKRVSVKLTQNALGREKQL
jgi:hypothetical protein